jgi:hypothetical protein
METGMLMPLSSWHRRLRRATRSAVVDGERESTSAIVPAVANAIFTATGKCLRKLPINAAKLKSG